MTRLLLSTSCLLLLHSSVQAHEPEPGSLLSLAIDPKVQKEIALTDEQRSEVEALRRADEKDAAMAQQALLKTLKRPQAQRLREIGLQARGGSALADEEIARELKLTPEQRSQVEKAWKNKVLDLQMREKVARFRTPAARTAWVLRNRKEQGEDLLPVLTAAQREAFEAMQGRAFSK